MNPNILRTPAYENQETLYYRFLADMEPEAYFFG